MADLHARFRRLDRVRTPDLWYEAVERAARADVARRSAFSPNLVLIALALLLAAMAGVVTVGSWLNRPEPAPRIITYENGMIVASEGCGALVSIDPSSLATRQLVAPQPGCEFGWDGLPAWSRSGERLAFLVTAHDETEAGIWVYETETDEARQIVTCEVWCSDVTISADGTLVAFVGEADESGAPALVVTEIDSGATERIPLSGSPRQPAFSPDGRQIAIPLFGGRSGVYLVDVGEVGDGHVASPMLVHGIVDASDVAWSPDGEWIAIIQVGGLGHVGGGVSTPLTYQTDLAPQGIVVLRTDGSDARVLATGPLGEGPMSPTWSADSRSIAYAEYTAGVGEGGGGPRLRISTVALDGSEPTPIYQSACCVQVSSGPAWSPDGEWILLGAMVGDDPAASGIVLLRPDGSDVRRRSGPAWEPVWQPIPND